MKGGLVRFPTPARLFLGAVIIAIAIVVATGITGFGGREARHQEGRNMVAEPDDGFVATFLTVLAWRALGGWF